MDKQQAIDFVLERIAHDYTQEEIARDLSHHLKAPPDVLQTFVAKVEEQHPHVRPEAQPELPAPEASTPAILEAQPGPAEEAPVGLPSAFLSDFDESAELPQQPPFSPQAVPSSPAASTLPNPESGTPASPKVAKKTRVLEDQELAGIVLSMLKKGRKRSDITMFICERTGMEWKQAQRFVAQVEVDNHKSISAHKNSGIVIFGILFALVGVVVLLFGLAALAPYLQALFGIKIDLPFYVYVSRMRLDAVIGILVTGFGLLVGGIVGTILAIQNQSKA